MSNRGACARWAGAAVVALAIGLLPGVAVAQDSTTIVQAGRGHFEGASSYLGVRLTAVQFGMGADILPIGTAAEGDLSLTMSGFTLVGNLPRKITLEGVITDGVVSPHGVLDVLGDATVDPGDGSPPLTGIAFTLSITPNTERQGTLALYVDQVQLNASVVLRGGVKSSTCILPEIGPSLRLPNNDTLVWTGTPAATVYHVYRGLLTGSPGFNHTCFGGPLATTTASDTDLPPVGRAFYYLVSASNACGENSLGVTTPGSQRPNNTPCP